MFTYIIKVTICWLGFYLIYSTLLKKETFFKFNRWYLLGTLILGAGIPLLEFLPIFQEDNLAVVYFQPINESFVYVQSAVSEVVMESGFDWMQLFIGAYFVGVAFFGIRFLIGLGKIFRLYRKSEILQKENYTLVLTSKTHLPFTFFNLLFWSKHLEVNDTDGQKIVTHEEAHVKGWHSVDVLLSEIMSIIFWCSPMVYFYKKSLKTVHEYLADAVVLQTTPTKKYGHLLLQQSQSGLQVALANHFIHSQLKQRIIMMTKNKSRKGAAIKYLFALPVVLLLLIIFSKKEAQANTDFPTTELAEIESYENLNSIADVKNFIGDDVDEMPIFPGCENEKDKQKLRSCSDSKLLTHIYTNIKYPKEARKTGIHGKVIIKYVVKKDGTIAKARIEKEIGGGCGEAALKVINSLPKMIPGMKDGKAVDVAMTLPVNFKLEGSDENPSSEKAGKDDINIIGMAAKTIINPKLEVNIKNENIKIRIDGKEASVAEAEALFTDEIKTINVEDRKVGEKEFRYILITTNKDVPNVRTKSIGKITYFINGKEATKAEVDAIPADRIATKKIEGATVDKNGVKEKVDLIYITTKHTNNEEAILFKVDEMPRFAGCENITNDEVERSKCAEMKLLKYVYGNIKYPKEAREADIQGRVIIQFVIQKDGTIAKAKIIRDIGGGCGEEAKRVINSMPKWIPGKDKGKLVDVKFMMPISFKLQGGKKESASKFKIDGVPNLKGKNPIYVLDGKRVTKEELKEIKKNIMIIYSAEMLDGESAVKRFGKDAKDGAIVLTSKKEEKQKPSSTAKSKKEDVGLTHVKISPNPSSGVINIEYESTPEPMSVIGYDIFGKELFKFNVPGGKSSIKNVNIKNAAKGTIFVSFKRGKNVFTKQVILQ